MRCVPIWKHAPGLIRRGFDRGTASGNHSARDLGDDLAGQRCSSLVRIERHSEPSVGLHSDKHRQRQVEQLQACSELLNGTDHQVDTECERG